MLPPILLNACISELVCSEVAEVIHRWSVGEIQLGFLEHTELGILEAAGCAAPSESLRRVLPAHYVGKAELSGPLSWSASVVPGQCHSPHESQG